MKKLLILTVMFMTLQSSYAQINSDYLAEVVAGIIQNDTMYVDVEFAYNYEVESNTIKHPDSIYSDLDHRLIDFYPEVFSPRKMNYLPFQPCDTVIQVPEQGDTDNYSVVYRKKYPLCFHLIPLDDETVRIVFRTTIQLYW